MNEVSLIGYHGTDFANTHTILSDNYQISEKPTLKMVNHPQII